MRAKVKICGITSLEDARRAAGAGADLLGFNFYPESPRYIEPAQAAKIIDALEEKAEMVGVFVNAGRDRIADVLKLCRLSMIQLHGDETDEECRVVSQMGPAVIKALRIQNPDDIEKINGYDSEYVLLDAFREDVYGGSGESFDWEWIRHPNEKKVFLAGGITPDNVWSALQAGTYGIDLASGVEIEPGRKDPDKIIRLFDEINFYYD